MERESACVCVCVGGGLRPQLEILKDTIPAFLFLVMKE